MWRLIRAQVRRHPGRAGAMIAAIVVTSVSFSLLTATVATSQVRVEGTVSQNFRNAYDILVRPPKSRDQLEASEGLVRQNYLSGIYGGISLEQYRAIKVMPGVDVAAPIAMIGYVLPAVTMSFPVNDELTPAEEQLLRINFSWTTDRGLSRVPDKSDYQYVTRSSVEYPKSGGLEHPDPVTGRNRTVCADLYRQIPTQLNAFDLRAQTNIWCNSTKTTGPRSDFFTNGKFGAVYYYSFPMLLAAVDPAEEARLVGLDDAIVDGRYLSDDDRSRLIRIKRDKSDSRKIPRVPVLMSNQPLVDQQLEVTVENLNAGNPDLIPRRLDSPHALKWMASLHGKVSKRQTITLQRVYGSLLKRFHKRINLIASNKWTAAPVEYVKTEGSLSPKVIKNDKFVWRNLFSGFNAPRLSADTNMRGLKVQLASNLILGNATYAPMMRWVGLFDSSKIRDYSELSEVPLTTYHLPDANPADEASRALLRGKPLLPNSNMGGYLQQPPTMLTTLQGMRAFYDSRAYEGADGSKPISVIRIRVAGVTGPDAQSRERVRVLAERIVRETGLDVDITIGSSPTDKTITLPGGKFGRPELRLSEGWVHKGVTVVLLDAIDRKSLVVSLLVLAVCLLFLINATLAAVRSRRRELGVLACLGWPRKQIFALLELELTTIGTIAGLLGTVIAALVVKGADLSVDRWQLLAITPLAALLAGLAAVIPVSRACRAAPIDALKPLARPPKRAQRVRSVTGLALNGMRRLPGRTFLGASCLFIGVAALTALIAIQSAFHGQVIGTRLGDFVAVQVRGVDYLAAVITVGLGAFAIADIAFLNIRERVDEIGTLQAAGWSTGHLRRMFATEGIATATLGAVAGTLAGLGGTLIVLHVDWQSGLTAALTATSIGITAATLALLIPLTRIATINPAQTLNSE